MVAVHGNSIPPRCVYNARNPCTVGRLLRLQQLDTEGSVFQLESSLCTMGPSGQWPLAFIEYTRVFRRILFSNCLLLSSTTVTLGKQSMGAHLLSMVTRTSCWYLSSPSLHQEGSIAIRLPRLNPSIFARRPKHGQCDVTRGVRLVVAPYNLLRKVQDGPQSR